MDDLPPHSAYYNYAYEQENQQVNDNVPEPGTENYSVLELWTWDATQLKTFVQMHWQISHFSLSSRINWERLVEFVRDELRS